MTFPFKVLALFLVMDNFYEKWRYIKQITSQLLINKKSEIMHAFVEEFLSFYVLVIQIICTNVKICFDISKRMPFPREKINKILLH